MKANLHGIFRAMLDPTAILNSKTLASNTFVNLHNETLFSLGGGDSSQRQVDPSGAISAPIYSFNGRMIIPKVGG
jgi:hypothetical protein